MPNLLINPAGVQSASNLLFRREKKDEIAPTLAAAYRRRMLDDPRYDRIASLEEGAINHIPNSGWAGAAAQMFSGYMAGKERRGLEKDYLGQQEQRKSLIASILANEPNIDPMVSQLAQDPELGEMALMSVFKNKLDPKDKPKFKDINVNGKIKAYREDDPTQTVELGDAPAPDSDDILEYNFAFKGVPEDQRTPFTQWMRENKKAGAGSTSVTLNAPGQSDAKWGKAPEGYAFIRDPNTGEVLTDPAQGGGVRPRIAPMIGSEDDTKNREQEAKAAKAKRNTFNQANIVIKTIDEAKKKIGGTTTGIGGAIMRQVPGTTAFDLSKDLDTIKAAASFSELQKMREASPTGGALGQVTELELTLLGSTIASVEQAQSPKELKAALDRHKGVYEAVINGGEDEALDVFRSQATSKAKDGWSIKRID